MWGGGGGKKGNVCFADFNTFNKNKKTKLTNYIKQYTV
jgi:hypothetical protein